jgi:predicted RNA-binding Zn-ribbon protein involved in translation (DUF1610 family)
VAEKRFECPNCAAPGVVQIDSIVRLSENPQTRDRVLCGVYFEWICPQCGGQFLIDDVFLYYDDIRQFMIYYVPGYKEASLPVPTLIRAKDGFDSEHSTLRVTARFLDLAEKIRIFEAGLDDRLVEAVKMYCSINIAKTGDAADDILFEEKDEDDTLFFSVYRNGECIGLPVPMEGYWRVQSDLAPLFDSPPKEAFIMIDQHWLADVLGRGAE